MQALEISNLHKKYPNGVVALHGIDLSVAEGDFFALLGPNGAGKTTTIAILTSLVAKIYGSVKIFGVNIDEDFALAKSYIGVVPQEFNFGIFENIIDIVVNQAGYYGISRKKALPKAEYYLNKLGLWHKRNEMAKNLSGGMKRRLMIARALVHEPKMLILDEPTAGVDIEMRRSTWAFLQELNKSGITIILTTHYLEEAEFLCRGIAIIDRGIIVENTTINKLVRKLNQETFILDLAEPVVELPEVLGCQLHKIDDMTIEIVIKKTLTLSAVFESLMKNGIVVSGLKNKTNRLEELFLTLVKKS